ncbi:MAG: YtxH domain-containing protein [Anaerolineales bacterium]|jgi:gas vesicle protein|nr:YtxH domain-containing protein [Anaerolineales bacterium]
MSDRDTDFGAFLAGFVLGGLAGAVTALLLAPQSGEETRLQIHDKSIELKDKATETAEEYRVRADEFSKQAKQRADEYVASTQEILEKQLERVQASKAETDKELAEHEEDEEAIEDALEDLDEETD